MEEFPNVSDHRYCQHFTLTPALSLGGRIKTLGITILGLPAGNVIERSVFAALISHWLAWSRTSLTGQPLREFRRDSIRAAAGFSMA